MDDDADYIDRLQAQWRVLRPDANTTTASVIGRITRIARLVQAQTDVVLAAHGVTRADFDVLSLLERGGRPMAPTELANELLTSAPGITKRIKRLVDSGLVERRVNPADARSALIHITPRAQSALLPILDSVWEFESNLLQGMTDLERDELAGKLKGLLRAIDMPTTNH